MMMKILEISSHRVLVCAETNLAVDNMATRFLTESNSKHGAIRIGRQVGKNGDKALHDINLESLVRSKVGNWSKNQERFILSKHKKVILSLFRSCRIVFTTCAGAGDAILHDQHFESVIIDEASMTTEPGALCPLTRGCCHLVLIGDHKQLGPHALGGKCVSLFERLSHPGPTKTPRMTMLNEQHRMHPVLCRFPSRMFYGGLLQTAPGIEDLRAAPRPFFESGSHTKLLDVSVGREKRMGNGSWYNELEIDRIVEIVEQLIRECELAAHEITILTFYRAQQLKIRERMNSWREAPEVCSVDGFQGRENEVIVVSTVRCEKSLGFCDDERRVNVLLTRARRAMVVVGNRATLSLSPLWSKWLKEVISSPGR